MSETGTALVDRGVLPTTEVVARVHRIQEVMKTLMKSDVHFGVIPGTPKPTLYKPGAELLLMTFRIAASPSHIEDLSTPDEVRYRVIVRGTNQVNGEVVGEMAGECSSNEAKYRWRKPVCTEEWDETDAERRRDIWKKGNPNYKEKQVRTSPADVANTILKMAIKRALIALTLVALGASDIFAQDLEDLADELRESVAAADAPKTETKQPQRKSTGNGTTTSRPATSQAAVPANAKVVIGLIASVEKASGKNYHTIKIKGDQRWFTTFSDTLAKDAYAFAGTDHQVKLAYTETAKDGRTFYNAVGVSIADAEPAIAETRPPDQGPMPDFDPFEPGSNG